MFLVILELIKVALDLWASKEKRKYIDEMLSIQKDYYEETAKPDNQRSDAVLDSLEFRAKILAQAIIKDIQLSK